MTGPREPARLVRWLACRVAAVYYRIDHVGPPLQDGPVLVLANHPNALLDPAIIWASAGRDLHFLGKAPLFAVPVFGWLLRWMGAIPTYRRVDDGDTSRNVEMFRAVADALRRGAAVCVFPEGISHSMARLQPLKTGAARIALDAASRGVPVSIVPIGLYFVRKWAFRSRVTVVVGEPFGVDAADAAAGPAPDAVQRLTATIAKRLRALVVEADPFTDAVLVDRVDRIYTAARRASREPADRVARRRAIAAGIARLRTADPERYEAIRERVQRYDARLKRFGLRNRDLDLRVALGPALRFALREGLAVLALFPLALAGLLVFAVPYQVTGLVTRRLESEPDVAATATALSGLAVYAAWTLLLAAAGWLWWGWPAAVLIVFAVPALAVAALGALEREADTVATVRAWLVIGWSRGRARDQLRLSREEIVEVLEEAYRWISERR